MSFLFFNPLGRLRSGWRFVIFVFGFLFCLTIVQTTIFGLISSSANLKDFLLGNWGFIVQNAATLMIAGGVGWFCQKVFEDLPFRAIGWAFQKFWWRDLILGILIGALTLLLAVGISYLAGAINFKLNTAPDFSILLQSLFGSLIIFILGAAAEETLFRGYPMQTLARAHFAWLGVLITSVPFALGHLENPNVVPFFTFANTALAGIWLAAAYLKTRNLWFPFGVHFAWNWTMAQFFGIPVSGITSITPAPFLLADDRNSLVWLSGGSYGLEGGAGCTIAVLLSTLLIWFAPFLKPDAELLALTNQENPPKSSANNPTLPLA